MAQNDSLHAFPAKMAAAALATASAAPKAVRAGSLILTQSTRQQIRTVAPGLYMRGVGKRGAKVDVRFYVTGNAGVVRATGPLHLLERSTKAHPIPAAGKGGGKLYRIPGVGKGGRGIAVRSIKHPGTRGQYPFAKGIAKGIPGARTAMAATMVQATQKALR